MVSQPIRAGDQAEPAVTSARSQRTGPAWRGDRVAHAVTLSLLLFLPALVCFFKHSIVADPDVWWHLKTGQWILAHGTWPTADSFSAPGAGRPWAAYSWAAELVLYGLHQTLGLRGLVLYTAGLSVAIVAAFHALLRRLQGDSLFTVLLTLVAAFGLIPLAVPRPWLFSILLFVIELDVLLTASRTGNRWRLLWLVPLFVLWANMHIQFMVGLVVLGIAVAESILVRIASRRIAGDDSRRTSVGWMLFVFALCVAATLVNPYHYHLYEVAFQLVGQLRLWNVIQELEAMSFRSTDHWLVLAVTVAAAFALGWRRRVGLLLPAVFLLAVYCGFRSHRDAWLVLLVGLTVLAYVVPRTATARAPTSAPPNRAAAAVVALLVFGGVFLVGQSRLEQEVAERFPARAVDFIAREQHAGPMFNSFAWGGYLIFQLPQVPVNIDGRTIVHGEERVVQHARTLCGRGDWKSDPELARARLVVLPRSKTLASLLQCDDRFQLLYEDSVAVVFAANTNPAAPGN